MRARKAIYTCKHGSPADSGKTGQRPRRLAKRQDKQKGTRTRDEPFPAPVGEPAARQKAKRRHAPNFRPGKTQGGPDPGTHASEPTRLMELKKRVPGAGRNARASRRARRGTPGHGTTPQDTRRSSKATKRPALASLPEIPSPGHHARPGPSHPAHTPSPTPDAQHLLASYSASPQPLFWCLALSLFLQIHQGPGK